MDGYVKGSTWHKLEWNTDWRPLRGRATLFYEDGKKTVLVGKSFDARTDQWEFVGYRSRTFKWMRYAAARLGLIKTDRIYPQHLEYNSETGKLRFSIDK